MPVCDQPGHDGHGRPRLPLRRRRGRTTRAAGRRTGTAAGSCTTTAARASSTACCSTPRPTRTAASRSTPTACATPCRGTGSTWTRSSGPTARCTCRSTTGSSAPARRRHLPLRLHRRAAHAGRRAQGRSDRRTTRCSSRAPARAACRTSGTSATARRPTEANPAHTLRRGQVLHRDADRDLRRRRHGHQGRRPSTCWRRPTRTPPVTTATTDPADPDGGTKPVTVTLTATDTGGSGVEQTEYRVDGGDWTEYTGPFKRSEPGEYTVEYRSTDRAGNEEAIQDAHVHDLGDPELPDRTSTTSSTAARSTPRGRSCAATTRRSRSPTGGSRLRDPRRRHDRRHGDGEERAAQGRARTAAGVATTRLDPSGARPTRASRPGWSCGARRTRTRSPRSSTSTRGRRGSSSMSRRRTARPTSTAGPSFGGTPREAYIRIRANGSGTYIAGVVYRRRGAGRRSPARSSSSAIRTRSRSA